MITKHILDSQFFNGNHAEAVDQAAGGLMNKVMATVPDALMDTRQNFVCFLAFRASLLGFGLLPARLCQCLFVLAEEARVVHELAIGQGKERVQPGVKANSLCRLWQRGVFLLYL